MSDPRTIVARINADYRAGLINNDERHKRIREALAWTTRR